MNEDIEEIKELTKKALALAEDTNRMVHKMRRSALWGRFLQLAWWFAIIVISGAAYYIYLQPYVARLEQLYGQVEGTNQQAQNWGAEFQQFLAKFAPPQKPQP